MSDLRDVFADAVRSFDARVRSVSGDCWDAQSPCAEWSVRDVVNHIVGEQLWVPHLLRGETIEQVGDRYDGDVLGNDPLGAWERASAGSVAAWRHLADLDQRVHLSFGNPPAREYAEQMILDLTVHGWDVARGAGVDERLDVALVEHALGYASRRIEAWRNSPMFATTDRPVNEDDPQDRLLALTGR